MIQQLLTLLPSQINSIALICAVIGAFAGAILWLGGSRFNQTLVTLISVSTGALIGLQLPYWFNWKLEGWATATLGAIVCGISGYLAHKLWVGIGLGIVLTVWAALATFVLCGDHKAFVWPAYTVGVSWKIYLPAVWNALTPEVRRMLPFACATAMVGGFVATLVWTRLGVVLLYSCTGISLLVGLGVAAMSAAKPQWLKLIPNQTSSQVIVLISMVAFGAVLQWRCAPGGRPRRSVRVDRE
jgi:hypothetical protein